MPSWIGPWEIAIVVVLVLLIFGPRKLPELGSSLGKSIRGFKKSMKEGQDELKQTVAEVKEATTVSDTPEATTRSAEAPAAKSAPATTTAATSEPAAATATATATATLPKCWGTYEAGHEGCLQCAVAIDCAEAGAEVVKTAEAPTSE
jgi:sec-independent protein translocase protein TatA